LLIRALFNDSIDIVFQWYTDWLNPTYWRRYRDPNYDRPLWNAWKPWQYDSTNRKRYVSFEFELKKSIEEQYFTEQSECIEKV
jgi:hypothetical protein